VFFAERCLRSIWYSGRVNTKQEAAMSNYIDPERDQFEAFKELPRDKPIMMLNLLRFRDKAAYEDNREATGAEAYAAYGREIGPIFRRVGGEIIWRGKPVLMVIGPADKRWDMIFVARYPTAAAFLEMVTDPDYRIAFKHRQAAVLDSRLVRTAEIDAVEFFAD
jgi:uncharacterized protein (DUF1330 family)